MAPPEGRVNTAKAGKILVGVGLGLAAVGGSIALASAAGSGGSSDDRALREGFLVIELSVMAVGGVCSLIGIPLWAASPKK